MLRSMLEFGRLILDSVGICEFSVIQRHDYAVDRKPETSRTTYFLEIREPLIRFVAAI